MINKKDREIDEIFSGMIQIRKALEKKFSSAGEAKAASVLQHQALRFLIDHPKSNVSDLSGYLGLSLSSTTQLVTRLHKVKLVKRIIDKNDRRLIRLVVTSTGEKELDHAQITFRIHLKEVFSQISSDDLQAFIRVQKKVLENMLRTEKE